MKKPIRLVVVKSTYREGLLSLRETEDSGSATWIRRALVAEGYKPGDLVEIVPVTAGAEPTEAA